LSAYPRQLEQDSALLEAEGVALLWNPDVATMYPEGYATNVSVSGVSDGLCGASRPGHFDGVATVVCKLFNQVLPDLALFGEKDWQQLAVIRRMARDLDLTRPAADAIIGVPTVREADGLAMSSRNAYLTQSERDQASALARLMRQAIEQLRRGEPVAAALGELRHGLLAEGFSQVDYAEVRDADGLTPLNELSAPARLLVAARIGKARLIDNMAI
jgi:pantoate--beta-alanine ligase